MNLYHYLQSFEPYFWKWEEGGDVIQIPNGSTIAYTESVKKIMQHIAEQGLPSFGSLLLILIAINKTLDNPLEAIEQSVQQHLSTYNQISAENAATHTEASAFLETLSTLPPKYREGDRKLALFQTLFQDIHNNISPKKAKKIITSFTTGYIDKEVLLKTETLHAGIFMRDFKPLALLHRKFPTANAIIKKMAELLKEELDLDEPETDIVPEIEERDFVEILTDNPKTFQIGRLLKSLWAGFKIPINTTMPSSQQFGGISDLTNKGDFDKLLISEFANDDLTFLSRLANNEALYLHREMPPAVDDQQRILLTDISLMNWGTPKVLAHACSIAIAHHPKALKTCKAFVVGKQYQAVDYDQTGGIIDALQLTDNSLHPAQGINLFLKEYKETKKPELFLITTPEALLQYALQRTLSEYVGLFKYIITVEKEGAIAFYKYQYGNKKLMQQLKLDLETLWKKNQHKPKQKQEERKDKEASYPILFAMPKNENAILETTKNKELYVVADGRLFKRMAPTSKGFMVVANNIPHAQQYAIKEMDNGDVHFLYFSILDRKLTILNVTTNEQASTVFSDFKGTEYNIFSCSNRAGDFFHINHNGTFIFALTNSQIHIEHITDDDADLLKARATANERYRTLQRYRSKKSIFKNVTNIYIDTGGAIVFNVHELTFQPGGIVLVKHNSNNNIAVESRKSSNKETGFNQYTFACGSIITQHPCGMFILKSSNEDLPEIYVPAVLDTQLGIATTKHFAGNEYYNPNSIKDGKYEVSFVQGSTNKIEIIKGLKDYTGMGLREAKVIVDSNKPTVIAENAEQKEAFILSNKLTALGAKIKLEPYKANDNKEFESILTIQAFNERYIVPFIQNIIQHANTGKTR